MTYRFRIFITSLAAIVVVLSGHAHATSLTTLYSFQNLTTKPYEPYAGLVKLGKAAYGTTYFGGKAGRGTVFKLNIATGVTTTIYSFTGNDGEYPGSALINVGGMLYGTTIQGGASGLGTIFSLDPTNKTETTLYSFAGADGANPYAALLSLGGNLYGATVSGGKSGNGVVFKFVLAAGTETTLHAFAGGSDGAAPYASLINLGGLLYGTASTGGAAGQGTIFKINPNSGAAATLYSFTGGNDGGNPEAPMINVSGTLYGTTAGSGQSGGTVFKFSPASRTETVLHDFPIYSTTDGSAPYAGLIYVGGTLYGTTWSGGGGWGTVFGINATTGAETFVTPFPGGNGGTNPEGGLITIGGSLLGTTAGGGFYMTGPNGGEPANFPGTVFKLDPATATITTLATFQGINPNNDATSGLIELKGILYGTTAQGGPSGDSAVFKVSATKNTESTLADLGAADLTQAALTSGTGLLFGTTKNNGTSNAGTVFAVDPSSGTLTSVYNFTGGNDGLNPNAALLDVAGTLYGTAQSGGAGSGGTVFTIDPSTGNETTLYSFTFGNDGGRPSSNLIYQNGLLYGTATYGGSGNGFGGVVFSLDPATGIENTVYSFTSGSSGNTDGFYPVAGLVDIGGILYGVTPYGGTAVPQCYGLGCGTVFSVDPSSGVETILHNFTGGSDGGYPQAGLLVVNGLLYGTTGNGGAHGAGTVFKIDPKSGKQTIVYNFTGGDDGAAPGSMLINSNGTLYGTTNLGGPGNAGTVFSLTP